MKPPQLNCVLCKMALPVATRGQGHIISKAIKNYLYPSITLTTAWWDCCASSSRQWYTATHNGTRVLKVEHNASLNVALTLKEFVLFTQNIWLYHLWRYAKCCQITWKIPASSRKNNNSRLSIIKVKIKIHNGSRYLKYLEYTESSMLLFLTWF
jgi:hypothetical protein